MKRLLLQLGTIVALGVFCYRLDVKDTALLEGLCGGFLSILSGVAIAAAFFLAQGLEDIGTTAINGLRAGRESLGLPPLKREFISDIHQRVDAARRKTKHNAYGVVWSGAIFLSVVAAWRVDNPWYAPAETESLIVLRAVHFVAFLSCAACFSCTIDLLSTTFTVQQIRALPRRPDAEVHRETAKR